MGFLSALNSIVGMVVLLGIAYIFSNNKKAINYRTVIGALILQIGIGALVLYVPAGKTALLVAAEGVNKVISYGQQGINFVFGGLADFSKQGFVFAMGVLAPIVFFSSLISVLYYLGIMQIIIRVIGGGIQKVLGTSRPETMSATANIFVGQTEAPLMVRPFIKTMTQSELFAVMCGGLASVAGAVMVGYAQLVGSAAPEQKEGFLAYLIAASFMAAPGGLLFAKILHPETEPFKDELDETDEEDKPTNVLEAAAVGASSGMHLAFNVGAMLVAFIALIALINAILGGVGGWFGYDDLSVQKILGFIFQPIAFLIGVPWGAESEVVGSLIGTKLVLNEFVAYSNLLPYLGANAEVVLSPKTIAIITFALCGFANLGSIAILIGGLGGMAENRRGDIARMGLMAVLAGTLSNLMSATIAGLFIGLGGAIM